MITEIVSRIQEETIQTADQLHQLRFRRFEEMWKLASPWSDTRSCHISCSYHHTLFLSRLVAVQMAVSELFVNESIVTGCGLRSPRLRKSKVEQYGGFRQCKNVQFWAFSGEGSLQNVFTFRSKYSRPTAQSNGRTQEQINFMTIGKTFELYISHLTKICYVEPQVR